MANKSKRFNKLFLKRYKKSKAFKYDKEMITELYNLFVENYKTTGYIFDGLNSYVKVNNYTELPKNLNSACVYLTEIVNIIYIFDKVLEFNYDMLAMDVIYNADKLTGKTNIKNFINNILFLTSVCVKNIYVTKRSYDMNVDYFKEDKSITSDNFFMKIISIINKYIDKYNECKKNYEYVNYLLNKDAEKLKRRQSSIFATIKLWYYKNIEPFFKWLISGSSVIISPFNSSPIV